LTARRWHGQSDVALQHNEHKQPPARSKHPRTAATIAIERKAAGQLLQAQGKV